jgi:hypothetical protein
MKRRSGASQFQPPFHSVEILKPLWDQRLQGLSVVALKGNAPGSWPGTGPGRTTAVGLADAGPSEGNGHEALAPDATSGLVAADSAAGRPSPAPSPTVPVATPWPSLEQGLEARLSGVG